MVNGADRLCGELERAGVFNSRGGTADCAFTVAREMANALLVSAPLDAWAVDRFRSHPSSPPSSPETSVSRSRLSVVTALAPGAQIAERVRVGDALADEFDARYGVVVGNGRRLAAVDTRREVVQERFANILRPLASVAAARGTRPPLVGFAAAFLAVTLALTGPLDKFGTAGLVADADAHANTIEWDSSLPRWSTSRRASHEITEATAASTFRGLFGRSLPIT